MKKNKYLFIKAFLVLMAFFPVVCVFADGTPEPTADPQTTYYNYSQFTNGFGSWRGSSIFKQIISMGWKGTAIFIGVDVFSAAMAYLVAIMQLGTISDPSRRAEAKTKLLSQIVTIALLGASPAVIMIFTILMEHIA